MWVQVCCKKDITMDCNIIPKNVNSSYENLKENLVPAKEGFDNFRKIFGVKKSR